MYPWVTHTHSHLGGKCRHKCKYCYVQAMAKQFPNMRARYSGDMHLIEKEFDVKYGSGKTIFIEHMNDIACALDAEIDRIFKHIAEWPDNNYVFQTKDPFHFMWHSNRLSPNDILGTTIETNLVFEDIMNNAPSPSNRRIGMMLWAKERPEVTRFVTIEPILDFDIDLLVPMIVDIDPSFVNIGADSKGTGLPEPSAQKVRDLIESLNKHGIEIKQKKNLDRIFK